MKSDQHGTAGSGAAGSGVLLPFTSHFLQLLGKVPDLKANCWASFRHMPTNPYSGRLLGDWPRPPLSCSGTALAAASGTRAMAVGRATAALPACIHVHLEIEMIEIEMIEMIQI